MATPDEVEQSSLKRSASPMFEPQEAPAIVPTSATDAKRLKTKHTTPEPEEPTGIDRLDESQVSYRTSAPPAAVDQIYNMQLPYPTPEFSTESVTAQNSDADLHSGDSGDLPELESGFNNDRPRLAAYHPYIRTIEKETPKVCNTFLTLYDQHKSAGYSNEALALVCEKILESCNPSKKYPIPKPVAFIGPMGVGKSQLICALLKKAEIASTSDTDRGTNIVHEFVGVKPDQESLFVVDCLYYSPSQIRQRILKLCRAAFEYFELSRKQEKDRDEVDTDELDELLDRCNTAAQVFFTLLCDNEDDSFASEDAVRDWLEEQFDEETLHGTVDQLMDRIAAFMDSRGVKSGMESHNASSIAELAEVYEKVSRQPKTSDEHRQRHPWPLVRKLQIHFDHDVLNQGVIMADTPGLTDSNKAIVEATKNYIHEAGTLFVVAPFLRCKDNAELDAQLKLVDHAGKMRTSQLILTKIDEKGKAIDKTNLPVASRDAIDATEKVIEQLEHRRDTLAADKARLGELQQWEEYGAVDKELGIIPGQLEAEKTRLNQHKVLGRNAKVELDMRGKYRKVSRSKHAPDLRIHFTSATEYEKHQQAVIGTDPPQLDLAATGIPAILDMLYRIPAGPKYDTLNILCLRKLPRLFENVTNIMTKTPFERHQEVRTVIKHTLDFQCQSVWKVIAEELEASRTHHIAEPFEEHQSTTWPEQAKNLLNPWEKLPTSTFTAFCRRKGKWKMAKGQAITSWNQQIQNIFSGELEKGFEGFIDDIKSFKNNTTSNITDRIFLPLRQALADQAFHEVSNSDSFLKKIDEERDDLLIFMDHSFIRLRKATDKIRMDTITSDEDDSMVAIEMSPTYNSAATIQAKDYPKGKKVKGKKNKVSGAHAERMRRIRDKVAGDGADNVFCGVATSVNRSFRDVVIKEWLKLVKDRMDKMCEDIMQEFDMRYQVPSEEEEGNEEIEAELREGAKAAIQYFEGRARKMLEAAKKWEDEHAK